MNFKPELAEAVMAGRKTVTRRLVSDSPTSHYYRERCLYRPNGGPGGSYSVCPGRGRDAIGRVVVTSVTLERLGHPDADEARREGFRSALEFKEAFAGINGRYDPDAEVWRIEFRAAEEGRARG